MSLFSIYVLREVCVCERSACATIISQLVNANEIDNESAATLLYDKHHECDAASSEVVQVHHNIPSTNYWLQNKS